MKRLTLITILISLFLVISSTSAETQSYSEAIAGLDPMDLSEVDPKVAGILRKYYRFTFGDSLNWDSIESIRVEGELQIAEKKLSFTAYKKKPNYMKVVVELEFGGESIFAYDGEDAWQLNTQEAAVKAQPMPEAEALDFIRDSRTGGHLLYPSLKGKRFEFVGSAVVEGDRVYELKTTLPDGQVIRSFFDMTSFAELYQIKISNSGQSEELSVFSDFRKISGVRIPFTSTLIVGGKQVYKSRILDVKMNDGVTPWIFSRPANSAGNKSLSAEGTSYYYIIEPVKGNSGFSMQAGVSPFFGIIGTALEIESAHSGEDPHDSDTDDSKQESEGSEK